MRSLIILAAASGIMAAQPAFAMDPMKCDEASMMKVQAEMDAMKDDSMKMQKDEAMKHVEMAKTAMKANKNDECAMHLEEAGKAMMKKN
ncbi:hypothetical protein MAUB1S_08758 [Mycolicibacterium aubagnense]